MKRSIRERFNASKKLELKIIESSLIKLELLPETHVVDGSMDDNLAEALGNFVLNRAVPEMGLETTVASVEETNPSETPINPFQARLNTILETQKFSRDKINHLYQIHCVNLF